MADEQVPKETLALKSSEPTSLATTKPSRQIVNAKKDEQLKSGKQLPIHNASAKQALKPEIPVKPVP